MVSSDGSWFKFVAKLDVGGVDAACRSLDTLEMQACCSVGRARIANDDTACVFTTQRCWCFCIDKDVSEQILLQTVVVDY